MFYLEKLGNVNNRIIIENWICQIFKTYETAKREAKQNIKTLQQRSTKAGLGQLCCQQ